MFRLTDEAAKLRLLAGTSLAGALVLPFDAGLASLSAEDFIDRILMRELAVSGIAVGFDFHFGKGRTGSPASLAGEGARRGVPVTVVPPFQAGAVPVSSSAIRSLLAQGQVREAADLLGYPWFVTARVIHGEKRGRELGYPTANLRLEGACGLRHGIYAVRIGIGEARFDGVASFGRRPTFDDGAPLLEVFLFGFDGDLYGQTLDVAFIGWIRAEQKFDDVRALVARMDADSSEARTLLAAAPDAFPPLGSVDFAP
jgi:riboflavin kinase/FMN adenylyltransferase